MLQLVWIKHSSSVCYPSSTPEEMGFWYFKVRIITWYWEGVSAGGSTCYVSVRTWACFSSTQCKEKSRHILHACDSSTGAGKDGFWELPGQLGWQNGELLIQWEMLLKAAGGVACGRRHSASSSGLHMSVHRSTAHITQKHTENYNTRCGFPVYRELKWLADEKVCEKFQTGISRYTTWSWNSVGWRISSPGLPVVPTDAHMILAYNHQKTRDFPLEECI